MKRRSVLGLVAGASGLSTLALGSGAFSFLRTERELSVEVENDYDAYLKLEPLGDGYADYNEGERSRLSGSPNTIRFRFPSADEREANPNLGLGKNSVYRFLRDAGEGPEGTPGILEISNQGTNSITVYSEQFDSGGPSIGIFLVSDEGEPLDPDGTETELEGVSTLTEQEGATVDVGDSIRVGFEVDTHNVSDADQYHETISIVGTVGDN